MGDEDEITDSLILGFSFSHLYEETLTIRVGGGRRMDVGRKPFLNEVDELKARKRDRNESGQYSSML